MLSIRDIARAYAQAPILEPFAVRGWRELAQETKLQADSLREQLQVTYTPDPEPYASADAMLRDIAEGRITVSVANSEHPVWSLQENCDFRLVHDVLGHAVAGSGFDWAGEVAAYERHLQLVESPFARWALFTEAVAQVAYALHYGGFGTQRVAYMPSWMQWEPLRAGAHPLDNPAFGG